MSLLLAYDNRLDLLNTTITTVVTSNDTLQIMAMHSVEFEALPYILCVTPNETFLYQRIEINKVAKQFPKIATSGSFSLCHSFMFDFNGNVTQN
jgi:hypothetical protein